MSHDIGVCGCARLQAAPPCSADAGATQRRPCTRTPRRLAAGARTAEPRLFRPRVSEESGRRQRRRLDDDETTMTTPSARRSLAGAGGSRDQAAPGAGVVSVAPSPEARARGASAGRIQTTFAQASLRPPPVENGSRAAGAEAARRIRGVAVGTACTDLASWRPSGSEPVPHGHAQPARERRLRCQNDREV